MTYKYIKPVWWTRPASVMILFVMPFYLLLFLVPQEGISDSFQVRTQMITDIYYIALGLVFLLFITCGIFVGSTINSSPKTERVLVRMGYLDFLAVVTISAYVVWFHGLILRPHLIVDWLIFGGTLGQLRQGIPNYPGVTSFTQFGIVYAIFYAHRVWVLKAAPPANRYKVYFILIALLTIFRAFVWGERLALLEFIVPIILIATVHIVGGTHRFQRTLLVFAPIFALLLLFIFFGFTEYFRSWNSYYAHTEDNFVAFVAERLATYYYTALNNGIGYLATTDWPTYSMDSVLLWLYRLPVLGPIVMEVFNVDIGYSREFLYKYADPEFNNMSGIFPVFADLGIVGALVYAWIWGGVLGYAYSAFTAKNGFGQFLYPAIFISVLEVFRFVYVGHPRIVLVIVGIAIGYIFFRVPKHGISTSNHPAEIR